MRARIAAAAAMCAVALATIAGTAHASTVGHAQSGVKATQFATGGENFTSFAWGDNTMFAGDSGSETSSTPDGGVYVIRSGTATEVPDSPVFVGGMAWHGGALYLSDEVLVDDTPQFQIERWSGWNGTTFSTRAVLYVGPTGFQGFDGLAFGPGNRLYVGVSAGMLDYNDHGPASTSPYLYDILSMSAGGQNVQVFASGIRQPWQMAFAKGSADPFVSDLGQDGPASVAAKGPPDFVLQVAPGDDFGFPGCNWTAGSDCSEYATPFEQFAPHSDIMGLAVVGSELYMGSYQGLGSQGGGAVYETSVGGGAVTPVVTGFPAATDALAAHNGALYAGGSDDQGGVIYRITR